MKRIRLLLKKTVYMMSSPQKVLWIVVFAMTCIGSILECLGVSAIIPLVNVIQDPSSVLQSEFVRSRNYLSSMTHRQIVILIGGSVILLYLFKNLYFIFLSWVRAKYSCKIQREMSIKILTYYLSREYQFFLTKTLSILNRGVAGDTASIYLVLSSMFKLLSEVVTISLICIFMLFTDWSMALAMVVMALICLILIYFIFRKQMYKAGEISREYSTRGTNALLQAFQGIKDVLLLRKQRYFINEYERNQIEAQKAQCKSTLGVESPAYIIEGLCVTGLMLIVCARIILGGADGRFIAVLAAFAVGAFRILPSLGKISIALNGLMSAMPSVDALYMQIKENEEYAKEHPKAMINIRDKTGRFGLINKGSYVDVRQENGDWKNKNSFEDVLELKSVSFRYDDATGNVLENIDLSLKKGKAIAFIGASGAGKSTLADILLGLLIPQEGKVCMDGINIADIPDKWSRIVGYVPQNVFLANTNIRNNVAFGEDDEEIDDDRVWEALQRAELAEFVKTLPEGVDTFVGDRGVRLSGGQRQRIAIARALYHRPEILVLDEATSALDNETEETVMSAIDSLQGQVTLIIIAHRLTTIRNCDIVYEVQGKSIHVCDKEEVLQRNK